ncbi:MAG: UDP-N-acetylmuramoyl-L-alanyl-D-glutamate--2,6-diaminopimelate ligase [Clostridia bacterium]|nr:UDP-N-acetylmuramoyl-L-alanyl-D-glutamate--2,6-diaminopimelate ligase [Clostridia bacterium]
MRLSELLSALPCVRVSGGTFCDVEITSVVSDSRSAGPGTLFVALRGREADGHAFVPEAAARGCAAVALETAPDTFLPIPVCLVPDTREAEALLQSRFFGDPASSMRIFAVTGTNGKTTTTAVLWSILRAAGRKTATVGTLGLGGDSYGELPAGGSSVSGKAAAMTTPDPAILYRLLASFRDDGVSDVVLEASSHALSQRKLAAVRPDFALFTNLSPEHLDFHGTMDAYLAAKAILFEKARRAVVSTASPYAETLLSRIACPAVTCGFSPAADYAASDLAERPDGSRFRLTSPRGTFEIGTCLPGRFMAENVLLAAAAALEAGVSPADTVRGIAACRAVPGRMETVTDGVARSYTVMIDYAHTPEALRALLSSVRRFTRGRLLVLFGCGGDRDKTKRSVMGAVAGELADYTVLTLDNCRTESPEAILSDILSGFPPDAPHEVISDRARAIRRAVSLCEDGDVLVLAGKGHEKYEIDKTGKHEFDERAVALAAMRSRDGRR